MAPNSLFAILLRSPWWISISLALVFGAASRALLPAEYWLFGAMGGLPFLAIGGIAAWRQLRAPSAARVEAILQAAGAMSWRDFANALELAFGRDGYTVQRLEGAAADFANLKDGRTTLVAAKRWKAAKHGLEALQDLHKTMLARDASACIYIALGDVSDNARSFASAHGVRLVQGAELAELLKGMPMPQKVPAR